MKTKILTFQLTKKIINNIEFDRCDVIDCPATIIRQLGGKWINYEDVSKEDLPKFQDILATKTLKNLTPQLRTVEYTDHLSFERKIFNGVVYEYRQTHVRLNSLDKTICTISIYDTIEIDA